MSLIRGFTNVTLKNNCFILGKYFPGVEDQENWHGKPLGKQSAAAIAAVKALIRDPNAKAPPPRPINDDAPKVIIPHVKLSSPPDYKLGQTVR